MSNHKFYDTLVEFAASKPLRLHMPGHKGKGMPMPEWDALSQLDFTELSPVGGLFLGDDWLEDAQRLWAWDWGMDTAFFCTGGSTQGNFTLFGLFIRPGDTIIVDRLCHKSIHHAISLYDARPVWLHREWDTNCAVTGPITVENVEKLLDENPQARAVIVTTPTYYGVLTALEPLAELCHSRGVKLLVDGAHGAHLPLVLDGEENCRLGYNPYACCDGMTISTHKTLPAPGQTAVVFANGVRIADVRRAASITGSTSPSYPMMAALDALRNWMWENRGAYRKSAAWVADLRRTYPSLPRTDLDPCRFTLQVEDGYGLSKKLEELGIYAEMADSSHVVCIHSSADDEKDFVRFKRALNYLGLKNKAPFVPSLGAPPIPETAVSLRAARFGESERIRLGDALGRVAAESIAPYPPGVPVVTMGERIDEKTLAYLYQLCYDENSVILALKEN